MKKFYMGIFCLSFLGNVFSQQTDNKTTAEIITKHQKKLAFTIYDLQNYIVSSSYKSNNTQYIYLLQSFKGLPIRNQMKVISLEQDQVKSNSGTFIKNVESYTANKSASPLLLPKDAVDIAFESEKIKIKNSKFNLLSNEDKFDFGMTDEVTENVKGQLMWLPVDVAGKLKSIKLIWTVTVAPKGTDDIWEVFVDATDGKVLGKHNYTVKENLDNVNNKTNSNFKNNTKYSTSAVDNKVVGPSTVAGASYLVIPYPAESPIHPGGTAAVRTNPWASASGNASTLGWHSNGTTDYNITRGNNVWATEDRASTNQNTGLPATSTTGPNPLTFHFPPNYTINPTNFSGFQQFAITNLFYWTNIMHDVSYQYGFDEISGNFQVNNLGRGGAGSDDLIALAQSGTGTNNANFSTPPDGFRPRMRMYLFDASGANLICHVNTPPSLVGNYQAVESGFSTSNKLQDLGPLTAQVAWFDDSTGTAHQACGGAATPLSGKIALINRGNCTFVTKALAAQAAGAVGIIMINNVATAPVVMGGTDNTITIPAIMVSQSDGALFAAQISNNLNVTLSGISFDGDVDNGIICHEYGHGISTRLTGGPSNSSCLGQSLTTATDPCSNTRENGSEGWSDYFGLMMTTNWTTANVNDGVLPRPIGTYVLGETTSGGGIRHKPYSTNFSINPQTYANVGDATYCGEIHNIGEIWCTAIWEMTWAIIKQENAINPNLYNYTGAGNGGNSISLKLVVEGFKLQPCTPGFIDSRDAILAADRSLYAGRHACSIWTAFAKRGMGFGASQGSSNSVLDQTASSALPPAPTIVSQPANTTVATGANASFTTDAGADVNLIYNWQVSTDGGVVWNNISPATITATLNLNAVTSSMNGYKYRAQVFIGCAITTTSAATLTVTGAPLPAIVLTSAAGTSNQTVCINTAVINITYTTSGGVTGATVTGLPSGVNGTYTAGTFNISGTPTTTGTFNYTVTTSGGTPNASATGTIVVSPSNTLILTSAPATTSQTVTVNLSITNIIYSTTGGVTGATVNGLPAGVIGSYSGGTNGTITISGAPTAPGTFNYTVTTSGGCSVQTSFGSITAVNGPSITLTSATGTSNQTVCINTAIINITYTTSGGVTGATVTGFPSGVNGIYTAGTFTISGTPTTTGTFNYTVTTSGNMASATGTISVAAPPSTPVVVTPAIYCQGATASALTATGTNLLWYTTATGGTSTTTAPIPVTTTVGSTTFYVSQSTGTCESGRTAIVVNVNATPGAPTVTSPVTYCQGATSTALTAMGTNLLWYGTNATGGTGSPTAPTPSTATAGSMTYYVSQTTGACEGQRAAIVVTVTALLTAPTVVSPIAYCQGTAATALTATGAGLLWFTNATGGVGVTMAPIPSTLVAGSVTYYVAQTNSCGEGARAAIVVNIAATPLAVTNLNATNITETSALLNWIGAAANFYTIEYKISTATTWIIAATGITANSITISNLIRGASYNYRVYANCSALGGGTVSGIATFSTSSRNSTITNIKKGFGLRLTPNPFQSSGVIDYLVPGNGTVGLTVIGANGKVVRNLFNANQSSGQYALNISNQLDSLVKGTYIIRLIQNGNGISLEFIKN